MHLFKAPRNKYTKIPLWLPLADAIREEFSSFITFVIVTVNEKNWRLPASGLICFKVHGRKKKEFSNCNMKGNYQATVMERVSSEKHK